MKHHFKAILFLFLGGCANVAMPTGGPRDKTPPELVLSAPTNNQRNFTGKSIELTFNEDIKLKDPKEEILIVPSVGKKTLFSVKKRKLIIEPELDWQPNTTYSFNFRDGVQDLTEGNPAENLRLAFSTGPIIDSLSINGSVKDIFIEKVPEKITIALYQSDSFDIFKHTPIYFTKSNKAGLFSIPNLKSANYFIYAFDDKNKNLKVDSKTEEFGFLSSPIQLDSSRDSLEIPMTMLDSRPLILTSIRHTDKTSRIRFNKQVDSLTITGITKEESIYSFAGDKSELIFYNAFPKGDSIKTHLIAKDSLGQKLDTTIYIRYGDIKTAQETFKTKEIDIHYNVPGRRLTYILNYNKPIGAITKDSIYIRYDSINTKPIDVKDITIDTLLNQITIKSKIDEIKKEGKEKPEPPSIILGKGALISIEQDSSKLISKPIQIPMEEDLGLVTIKVETIVKNYIVQLITTENKVVESVRNSKDYTFKHIPPLEYKLRIIIDENRNHRWDAGNFHLGIEPEKIILFKSEEGKYTFPLRANWELGPMLIKF